MSFNPNTKIIWQGVQRCQDNCTIPTKNLKNWEYLGRGVSLLLDFSLKMPTFLRANQKKNETKTNEETNTHKKNAKKAKLHSVSTVTEFFNSCVNFITFYHRFERNLIHVSLYMATVPTVWILITDQLRDTLVPPPHPPPPLGTLRSEDDDGMRKRRWKSEFAFF